MIWGDFAPYHIGDYELYKIQIHRNHTCGLINRTLLFPCVKCRNNNRGSIHERYTRVQSS